MSGSGKPEPTAFQRALAAHMAKWRSRQDGSRGPFFAAWEDGVHRPFREDAAAFVERAGVRMHSHAKALRSSQVFAFNLFVPWRRWSRAPLEARLALAVGTSIVVDEVILEWVPPGDLLGEIDADVPRPRERATAVDTMLMGQDGNGARVAVLIEIKLSEDEFTPCGGRDSSANLRRDVCESASVFFRDPSACYLRRPRGKVRDRRYWEIFANAYGSVRRAFPRADETGECPFAGHQQQPMRNFALAKAMVQAGMVERAWFVLCAHDANPDVAREWERWRSLLADPREAPVLPASQVVAAGREGGHPDWAQWMAERYSLSVS